MVFFGPIARYTAARNFAGILEMRVVGRAAGDILGVSAFRCFSVPLRAVAFRCGLWRRPVFSATFEEPVAFPIKRTPAGANAATATAVFFRR